MFYPADLPPAQWLTFYASRFDGVELQNTMYRLPREHVVAGWRDAVPAGFRFAVKASRRITHEKALADAAESVAVFSERLWALGPKLALVLYQLPPKLRRDDDRLAAFLAALPAGQQAVFEFRHSSWFADPVHAMLREHGAAICVSDLAECPAPDAVTAPLAYFRLYGPGGDYRTRYGEERLRAWAQRIRALSGGLAAVHVYLNNDEADAPGDALELRSLLAEGH